MVLSACGVDRSEQELRALCDTGLSGTDALLVVDAARNLGMVETRKYTLDWPKLVELIADPVYPIVYVMRGLGQHAIVVRGTTADGILVHDPLETAPAVLPATDLELGFMSGPRTVILVER